MIVIFKGMPHGMEWGCVRGSSDWTSVRKRFSTDRVAGHWNRLPREAVMALSLSEFREYLHIALSRMVYFQVVLPGAGSWAWQCLWVPFNSKDSGILGDTPHVECDQISRKCPVAQTEMEYQHAASLQLQSLAGWVSSEFSIWHTGPKIRKMKIFQRVGWITTYSLFCPPTVKWNEISGVLHSNTYTQVTGDGFCFYMRARGLYIIPGTEEPAIFFFTCRCNYCNVMSTWERKLNSQEQIS